MTPIPVETDNVRVEIDDGGIAHLVFGPAAIREKRAPKFGRDA